jgi:hypothetical protein
METLNSGINGGEEQKDNPIHPENNDSTGYDDDTLGENTELTPLAAQILKDKEAGVAAKENQENKDFSEKNG